MPHHQHMAPMVEQVAALVERARGGDPTAFRDLFRLHVGRVHRIVYRLAGATADLDDLVQTVFVEGFRSLPTFRGEARFAPWRGRIAVRGTLRAKKRAPLALLPLDEAAQPPTPALAPDEQASARQGLRRLDALLAALRPKKR